MQAMEADEYLGIDFAGAAPAEVALARIVR
jgi:hypothetical protein